MAGIGSKDTKPELAVRRYLHRSGFRLRLQMTKLPGKPDVVLPKHWAVIFVQGYFLHRHSNRRYATAPSSSVKKWTEKFAANMARDARNTAALRDAGSSKGLFQGSSSVVLRNAFTCWQGRSYGPAKFIGDIQHPRLRSQRKQLSIKPAQPRLSIAWGWCTDKQQ